MADKKISQLTAAATPLAGTEVLPIVQGTSTVKVANNDLRPKQIQSNTTTGVLQVTGPAAGATRVMTTPDANFTAARTDAAQTFTGVQVFNDNVGIAATPSIWNSNYKALNVGNTVSLAGATGYAFLNNNVYFDSTDTPKYLTNTFASIYRQDNGNHRWYTAPSGTAGDTVTLTQNMTLDTSGNLSLVTGNLVMGTSGKGIAFSATPDPAGMTSEILTDYEEGTWTPVFTDNVNGQAGQTYSAQLGTYTKVGRVVTANFYIALSAIGTWGGFIIRLSGLPYAAADSKGILTTGFWTGLASNTICISGTTYSNYSFCDLYLTAAAGTGMSGFSTSVLGNSSQIYGVVTYTV